MVESADQPKGRPGISDDLPGRFFAHPAQRDPRHTDADHATRSPQREPSRKEFQSVIVSPGSRREAPQGLFGSGAGASAQDAKL